MLAKVTLKQSSVRVVDFPQWRICVAVWVMEARGAAVFGKVLSSDSGNSVLGFPDVYRCRWVALYLERFSKLLQTVEQHF